MKKIFQLLALGFSATFIFSCQNATVDKALYLEEVPNARAMDQKALSKVETVTEGANYTYQVSPEPIQNEKLNTEEYDKINENTFKGVAQTPVSTFSIDVDNASYSNIRRYLEMDQMPLADAVRIEEMINYFDYDYPQPQGQDPFSINTEISTTPWNSEHHLIHIGLQGKDLDYTDLKSSNLVFLIDASGSMSAENKLPLLKKSLKLLLSELDDKDKVAIVAYAGAAGLVLPSTPASEHEKILNALDGINSGGSTAGGQGIELAYNIAKENLIADGNNRVILATDGDFNVGVSSSSELVSLIEEKRKDNIYLTICGFGMGNYKDGRMEQISNAGNGNYFYIDNIREAKKVFVTQMRANMFTIAKDVKIQIEFNPKMVKAYRLIGYENRLLANEDFDDDTKDAGELGAGHTVTAIYEVILANSKSTQIIHQAADLKYQTTKVSGNETDLMTVKFRYKPIQSDQSILLEQVLKNTAITNLDNSSDNYRFSAAVAGFGMLLRNSKFKGSATYDSVLELAKGALGNDKEGYRTEFLQMVQSANTLETLEANSEN
ncbi:von Willebrand factor type A domain-containing protein [Aureispira sp. CCB-E]|uniref:vWA domain-containing protein n=1 Tax=Aureispira sp. CCB-E TaxID=3051121 RepID=UPI0028691D98|nr:von Willebrand factor type A domain-containing protein [Aureispira sp. CCB-E]WMX15111.1 von Willebrand factor type A domain-containing protein [Aureispira sp. CCB-E]